MGEKIFQTTGAGGLGWQVLDFLENVPDSGFAASLYGDGNEKVLAIRGTETDGEQFQLDLIQADLQEIGGLGMALTQAVSLFNYVQVLKGERDAAVLQLTLHVDDEEPVGFPT